MIKKLAFIPIVFLLFVAIDTIITGNISHIHNAPLPLSLLVGGAILYRAYILWDQASDTKDIFKNYNIKDILFDLDKVREQDKQWILDIKKFKIQKRSVSAYSKQGAIAARNKAKRMGIEECFFTYLSYEEAMQRKVF